MEILLALLFTATIFLLSRIVFKRPSQQNLPPGPKPWPIIGNLMYLLRSSSPHRSLHSLSRKYGGIMTMKFGKFPVVIASTPEIAKQFLKVHDVNFASRPSIAAGKYTAYYNSDMTWAPYGHYWRQARKTYLSEVFSPKRLKFFEPIRVEENRRFLSRLHSLSVKPVVLREHLSHYTLSNISRIVFSNKYFSETGEDGREKSIFKLEELQGMLDEWFLLNGVINIGDWIPWLRFLDLQGYVKRMKDLYKKLDRFNEFVLDDHQARRVAAQKDFVPKDVVDILLLLVENPNLEVQLTRDNIKALLQDLLAGGTDTSASLVEWAIVEGLRHPRVAEKAKEELNKVIGRGRWVEESHFSQLPYINAIIMESLRLHPLSPLIIHCAIQDCKVAGYDIPKGTPVLINTWSLGRDPNSWDAPEEFLPERFLGKEDIDATGSNFSYLPFGSGRRRCPGYKLGTEVVRTTLANLLHGFEMKLVDGMRPQDICMEESSGLTTHLKESIKLIMKPTLPPHLYQV